jgi:hypothetical protein
MSLELILEQEEAKELAYLFKHYLIQEVAYNTILQKKRKELHALIAKAIERVYADKLKEFYELLAFHYERAEEWEKAAEYLSRAGRKVGEIFSKDEAGEFDRRKDNALVKIHESRAEERTGLAIIGVITGSIVVPLALFMMAVPVLITLTSLKNAAYVAAKFWLPGFVAFLAALYIVYAWTSLFFIFWFIVPFFRKKPKIFDLTEDKIRVIFKDASIFVIPFADINRFRFFDPIAKRKRPLVFKIFDALYLEDDLSVSFFQLLKRNRKRGNPYPFGFSSKEGGLYVERVTGVAHLRIVLPWLNVPAKAKLIALTPTNPREFFDQLKIAYEKWKRRNPNLL